MCHVVFTRRGGGGGGFVESIDLQLIGLSTHFLCAQGLPSSQALYKPIDEF